MTRYRSEHLFRSRSRAPGSLAALEFVSSRKKANTLCFALLLFFSYIAGTMKKNLLLTCILPLLWSGIACSQSSHAPDSQATAGDRKGVDDFNRVFIDSCRTMNHAQAAELWADDGVDLLPGMDPMIGKAAISTWLNGLTEQMKGAKMLQCDIDWQKIQVSGNTAYEWGINTQTVSIPSQSEPFKNKGKITLILRKQTDGSWKVALESWNSSPQAKNPS